MGLLKPHNIGHMFNSWPRGVNLLLKLLLRFGAAVTCWSIEKKKLVLRVNYLVIHRLRTYLGYPEETGFA